MAKLAESVRLQTLPHPFHNVNSHLCLIWWEPSGVCIQSLGNVCMGFSKEEEVSEMRYWSHLKNWIKNGTKFFGWTFSFTLSFMQMTQKKVDEGLSEVSISSYDSHVFPRHVHNGSWHGRPDFYKPAPPSWALRFGSTLLWGRYAWSQ